MDKALELVDCEGRIREFHLQSAISVLESCSRSPEGYISLEEITGIQKLAGMPGRHPNYTMTVLRNIVEEDPGDPKIIVPVKNDDHDGYIILAQISFDVVDPTGYSPGNSANSSSGVVFEDMFKAQYPEVFRYLYYKFGDVALAEDYTQEVFTRALANLDSFQLRGVPFHHWLLKLSRNLFNDHWRSAYNRRTNSYEEWVESHGSLEGGVKPDEIVLQNIDKEKLIRVFSLLTDEEKEVLGLRFIEDFTHKDVAATLGKSSVAVRQIQSRALKRLRKLMAGGS